MSETLPTDEDLAWMKDFGNDLHKQAAAEIRELRDLSTRRKDLIEYREEELANTHADNAKLREDLKKYGRHTNRCSWSHYESCDCGLDDALKDPARTERIGGDA